MERRVSFIRHFPGRKAKERKMDENEKSNKADQDDKDYDAILDELGFGDDEVIQPEFKTREEREAHERELRRLIAVGDADIAAGRVYKVTSDEDFFAEVMKRRAERLSREKG